MHTASFALPCLLQKKLQELGLESTPEEFVDSLPAPVKRRVEVLLELQEKHDEVEAQFRKERAELELKYEKLYGGCTFADLRPFQGGRGRPLQAGRIAPAGPSLKEGGSQHTESWGINHGLLGTAWVSAHSMARSQAARRQWLGCHCGCGLCSQSSRVQRACRRGGSGRGMQGHGLGPCLQHGTIT